MEAEIWDIKTKKYEKYDLPKGATFYETDLEIAVNCAYCGKVDVYGNMFTSRRIHNSLGLGYAVCEDCYYKHDFNFLSK